jgi:co-chaperonin GroES (HSP10)
MKVTPAKGGVLLKPILPQTQVSPIVRAQAYEMDRVQAVVWAVGPGRVTRKGVLIPPEVRDGQIVYIGANPLHAQELKIGEELFLLAPETSILGILTSEK